MVRRSNYSFGLTFGLVLALASAIFSQQALAQSSPSKIRGYKVHNIDISISSDPDDIDQVVPGVLVDFGDPVVSGFSLTGVTFDLRAAITSFDQSGTIDFVSFEGIKVNGIDVGIAEFKESFSFKKGHQVTLSSPLKVFVNGLQGAKAVIEEFRDSKDKWRITGKAYVFGKFKKGIFKFKRVIPVKIDLIIEKPSVKIPDLIT